ncbi:MAG: type VII secretion integral membrane protein EccD, partial [Stackebrandtia sp.]
MSVVAGVLALVGLWLSGPPMSGSWLLPGICGIVTAILLLTIGVALARASGDSLAGATLGGLALPFAALGGYLILGGSYPMAKFDASHLLVGAAALLIFAIVGFYAVGESLRVFTAGVVVGFMGLIAAVLSLVFTTWSTAAVAAATVSITVALLPSVPLLSMRFAKLPMPELPQSAKELVKDTPNPPKEEIFAKVVRADELLTGLLIGVSIITA